jgi:transposase InsO family protein
MLDLCRLIFGIARDLLRSRVSLEAEILVLRRQINVLRRANPKRLRFDSIDRVILRGVCRLFPRMYAHPTAQWIANQLTEACGWEQIPRYLIRDRDGAYGEIFLRRIRSIGIRDRPTSPRSPWQNGYAERSIGSIRRECLDHIVEFGERHLRHVLLSYVDFYNGTPTHLSLTRTRRYHVPCSG